MSGREPMASAEVEALALTPQEWARVWHASGNGINRMGRAVEEFELILNQRVQAARDEERARVGAEALREAADAYDARIAIGSRGITAGGKWLRDRADRIEATR